MNPLYKIGAAILFCGALVFAGRMWGVASQIKTCADAAAKVSKELADLKDRQAAAGDKIITVYVEKGVELGINGNKLIDEVDKYVTSADPSLPGGFRVYHDLAATGAGLPASAGAVDETPVGIKDLAITIGQNYLTCRQEKNQLEALQKWALSVSALKTGQ